jgi:TolA-binding protein
VIVVICGTRTASAFDDRKEGAALWRAYVACELEARGKRWEAARECVVPLQALARLTETKAELEYRRAEWLERGEHFAEARDAFLVLVHNYPREEYAARARFRAARILEDRFDKGAQAEQEYRAIVHEAPESIAALNALVHIEERLDEHARVAFYEAELAARPSSRLARTMLARLGQATLGTPRAVKAFDTLAEYQGASKDDALFFGAKAHWLTGDAKGAEERLLKLLATKEFTLIPGGLVPGNLHTSMFDDARYMLGEIKRAQKDLPAAKKHFEALVDESPDSRLVDDALRALAELALQGGDRKAAAGYYKRMIALRPHSRFIATAQGFKP